MIKRRRREEEEGEEEEEVFERSAWLSLYHRPSSLGGSYSPNDGIYIGLKGLSPQAFLAQLAEQLLSKQ